MDVLEAIYSRRSTRSYRSDPPPESVLEALIDAAIQAPCAVNRQAWRFNVITNHDVLNDLSRRAKAFMVEERPLSLPESLYQKLADPHFQLFYNAPALIVISANQSGQWIEADCALAAGNLMLAATAKQLGTCWIGLSQPFLGTAGGRALAGLPAELHPVAPVVVGFPADPSPSVERRPAVVNWIR